MPVSPDCNIPSMKIKGAATAAFLFVLLVAVLPFFFSGDAHPSGLQVASVISNEPILRDAGFSFNATENNLTVTVQTQVSVSVEFSDVALGNAVLVRVSVSPPPPTADYVFDNVTVLVLRPDGTAALLGPFLTDSNGSCSFSYLPEMIGAYKIGAAFGGQFFGGRNVWYSGSDSSQIVFAVLSDIDDEAFPNVTKGSVAVADTNSVYSLQYTHQVVALLPNGTLCAVFSSNLLGTVNNYAVYVASSNDNGVTWSGSIKVSNGSGMDGWACSQGVYGVAVAADSNNDVFVAWTGVNDSSTYFQVWCTRTRGSTWDKPVQVSQGAAAGVQAFYLSIAADGSDCIHLVWQANMGSVSSRIFYSMYDGAWSSPVAISAQPNSMYSSLAVDSKNNLHVVYTAGSTSIYGERRVWYTKHNGTWRVPVDISARVELNGYYMDHPCIAVDYSDNVHVVWDGVCSSTPSCSQIWYASYTDSWSSPTRISDASGIDSSSQQWPTVAVGFDNRVHVMWTGMSGHALFYVGRGSSWSVPVKVEANGAYPHFRWSYHPLGISVVESLDYVFLRGTKLELGGLSF